MNVRDIIYEALRLSGGLSIGQTPSDIELLESMSLLNRIVESWNLEDLMLPGIQRLQYQIEPDKQAYLVGIGGDIPVQRPASVDRASVLVPDSGIEIPLLVMADEEWQRVPNKTATSAVPRALYYEQAVDPVGRSTVYLWPVPSVATTGILYVPQALAQFGDLSEEVAMPYGYTSALIYNLALELIPRYGGGSVAPAMIAQLAQEYKARIKTANIRPLILRAPDDLLYGGGGGGGSWQLL